MRNVTIRRPMAAVLLTALIAGCSGGDDGSVARTVESVGPVGPSASPSASPGASVSPSPSLNPIEAARLYMEAFSTKKMQAMVDLAAPGSAAKAYAIHQQAARDAAQAAGEPAAPNELSVMGESIEVCDPGEPRSCSVFSDFQVLPNGQVVTFKVDGVVIDSRLIPVADRPAIKAGGASGRVISAYRSVQTDDLIVVFEVRNETSRKVSVNPERTTYVGTGGRQATSVAGGSGPVEVQPGAVVPLGSRFPGADPGGTLSVDVVDASTFADIGTLSLPVS